MPCVFPLTVDEVAVLSAFPLSPLALAALAPSLAANPPEGPALFGHVKGKYVGEEEMRWREERAGRKKWLRENKWESGGEKERDKEGRVEERRREGKQGRVEEKGKHGVLVG